MAGREIAGRYFLEESIGHGAMGIVWRAHDRLLDRKVAVKEVMLSAAIDESEVADIDQRTQREARTAARLNHPGIVTVHDVAEEDGRLWIVMELVPSRSLDKILALQGPLTAPRAARIGQQLLAALTAAHVAGVLHRDVKPSNVLIAPDSSGAGQGERAVLTDFGIAQFEGDSRITQIGLVMGTPGFTAPERLRGQPATQASDLWALGATLYAAVEGRGPFERNGMTATLTAIVEEAPPRAQSAGRLAPLIAALLCRDPSVRPSSSDAARMFADILGPMPTDRAPTSPSLAIPPDQIRAGTAPPLRADTELSLLSAPPAPQAPLRTPTQTFPQSPPISVSSAAADPPRPASDLLRQFTKEAGDSRRPARSARSRGSARRARKAAPIALSIVAVAAIGVGAVVLKDHLSRSETAGAAADTISPTAPSQPTSTAGLPPIADAPAVVKAIDTSKMKNPPNYTAENFFAAQLGTKAGFTIDVPPTWTFSVTGKTVTLTDGTTTMEIDLTQHVKPDMVSEAEYLAGQDRAQFPGYQRVYGKPLKKYFLKENIRETPGALWQFDWVTASQVQMREDALLFTLAGQSYTIYMSGPAGPHDNTWNNDSLGTVTNMLPTFDGLSAPSSH